MEQDIHELVSLAGHRSRYQAFIVGIVFLIWVNTSVFNYSLAFLESMPKISHTTEENGEKTTKNVTLTYELCEKEGYEIIQKYEHSAFTDFNDGTECEQLKVSLIGTVNYIGSTIGNIFFGTISNCMGMRRHLVIYHILYSVFLVVGIVFKSNYYVFQLSNLVAQYACKSLINASLVLSGEIIDYKLKTITNGLINSGLGIGGMFYVLMFLLINKWYYVFVVSIGIALVTAVIVQIWFFDSLKECLLKKDFKKFMKNIKYIASKNGRLKEFEEGIKTEKYKAVLERLKSYTIAESEKVKELGDINENKSEAEQKNDEVNIENDINDKSDPQKNEVYIDSEGNEKTPEKELESQNKENNESPEKDNHNMTKEDIEKKEAQSQRELLTIKKNKINNNDKSEKSEKETVEASTRKLPKEKTNKKGKQAKGTCIDLIKYPSIRYKFLLICLFRFCNGTLFSGLAIGLKSLKGSLHRNTAILYLVDFFGYNVSGFASDSCLGRKGTLQLLTGCYGVFSLIMFFCFNINSVVLTFYFCTRFCIMCAFSCYYTLAYETYPLSVASIGFGVNTGFNSFAGMLVPFIIEYIEDKYVFLMYGIFGVVCFALYFFIPETKGKPIPDNIKEVEEAMKKEEEAKNVEIVIGGNLNTNENN